MKYLKIQKTHMEHKQGGGKGGGELEFVLPVVDVTSGKTKRFGSWPVRLKQEI